MADLEATLAKCQSEFEQATAEKLRCQQEAETTAKTIELANRLVGGLAAENVRWAESINQYRENEKTLAGTCSFLGSCGSWWFGASCVVEKSREGELERREREGGWGDKERRSCRPTAWLAAWPL